MITNNMYEHSIALIYLDNKAIGWMSTENEAEQFCVKYTDFQWDNYFIHRDYVNLTELTYMTLYSRETESTKAPLGKIPKQKTTNNTNSTE